MLKKKKHQDLKYGYKLELEYGYKLSWCQDTKIGPLMELEWGTHGVVDKPQQGEDLNDDGDEDVFKGKYK